MSRSIQWKLFVSGRGDAQRNIDMLREKDDAGQVPIQQKVSKRGLNKGREVFIFSRVDTKTSGGLHHRGPKGRITHRRCGLDWIFRQLELS